MIKCIFCCVYSDMEKPDGPDERSRGMLQELAEAQVLFNERIELCYTFNFIDDL